MNTRTEFSLPRLGLVGLGALLLSACTTQKLQTPGQPLDSGERIAEAVSAPFADLNLVRAKIPEVLLGARAAPYAQPQDCAHALQQWQDLSAVLGKDLDAPRSAGDQDWFGDAGDALGDAAISGLRGAAEGLLPFRGWIRRLSGAERYSREVTGAIAAGLSRRAYVRGWMQGQACAAPAMPAAPARSAAAASAPMQAPAR